MKKGTKDILINIKSVDKLSESIELLKKSNDLLKEKLIWIDVNNNLPEKNGFYECIDIENFREKNIIFVFTCNFKDNLWQTNVTHWRSLTTKNIICNKYSYNIFNNTIEDKKYKNKILHGFLDLIIAWIILAIIFYLFIYLLK